MVAGVDRVEMLLRSPLLATMDPAQREALALRFETRPFTPGQVLLSAGADGDELLEILAGTAEVFVRDEDTRYRIAVLEPGGLAGELTFFDADAPRSADVVGTSEGIVAALPRTAYLALAAEEALAATALERSVIRHISQRLYQTNAQLTGLIESQRTGGLVSALGRWFGVPTPVVGVRDG